MDVEVAEEDLLVGGVTRCESALANASVFDGVRRERRSGRLARPPVLAAAAEEEARQRRRHEGEGPSRSAPSAQQAFGLVHGRSRLEISFATHIRSEPRQGWRDRLLIACLSIANHHAGRGEGRESPASRAAGVNQHRRIPKLRALAHPARTQGEASSHQLAVP